uniref:SHSP domain-containing protein n=1 Tax=Cajanus cajan TaxID=3821 RepID=A0A151U6V3_CAJCA|nr:hypothetical protein KK1_007717 [Cajanus cajan]
MGNVRVHTVEIHPGLTKIVVRDGGSVDQLELDMWRFRLLEFTRSELTSAVVANGKLIVTVLKEHKEEHGDDEDSCLYSTVKNA